jgi:hypothetical protein
MLARTNRTSDSLLSPLQPAIRLHRSGRTVICHFAKFIAIIQNQGPREGAPTYKAFGKYQKRSGVRTIFSVYGKRGPSTQSQAL